MTIGIDLYRTDDYVAFDRIPVAPLLRAVFEAALGQSLGNAEFHLTFHAVADARELDGEPSVVNLRGSHGYVSVRITSNGRVLYQHPHAIREIVARPLQRWLGAKVPEEKHWGFGIAGPGLEGVALARPAPRPAGSVDLRVSSGRPRLFHLEKLPEPEPPEAALADFGVRGDADSDAAVGVVLTPEVHEALLRGLAFSSEVEEGGFLVGQVFHDRDRPGRHLVRVDAALPAERTGASLLQFTFTGESFLRVNDAVDRRGPHVRLAGWYHTHLFPASDRLGLSTIDVELHARTFLRPWHVAALVNLDGAARQLRIYHWDGSAMKQLPYWVGPEWTR